MKVIEVVPETIDRAVKEALQVLQNKGVVACPTDTVYGLLADATNKETVERVFQIKERERSKALPVFVRDIEMAKELAHVSLEQERFLNENWPGKVTVILESKHVVPEELEADGKVALRIPDYDLVSEILKKLDRPLTGTSANISGEPSCSETAEVIAQFEKRKYRPNIVLNAGELPKVRSSRVVDITGREYKVIRK